MKLLATILCCFSKHSSYVNAIDVKEARVSREARELDLLELLLLLEVELVLKHS